jgi:hypothetical protein
MKKGEQRRRQQIAELGNHENKATSTLVMDTAHVLVCIPLGAFWMPWFSDRWRPVSSGFAGNGS